MIYEPYRAGLPLMREIRYENGQRSSAKPPRPMNEDEIEWWVISFLWYGDNSDKDSFIYCLRDDCVEILEVADRRFQYSTINLYGEVEVITTFTQFDLAFDDTWEGWEYGYCAVSD